MPFIHDRGYEVGAGSRDDQQFTHDTKFVFQFSHLPKFLWKTEKETCQVY